MGSNCVPSSSPQGGGARSATEGINRAAIVRLTGLCPERLLGEPWPWEFRRSWGTQLDLFSGSSVVGQFRVQADDPAFPLLSYLNRRAGVTWACGLALPCVAIAPDLIADFGDGG